MSKRTRTDEILTACKELYSEYHLANPLFFSLLINKLIFTGTIEKYIVLYDELKRIDLDINKVVDAIVGEGFSIQYCQQGFWSDKRKIWGTIKYFSTHSIFIISNSTPKLSIDYTNSIKIYHDNIDEKTTQLIHINHSLTNDHNEH